MKTLLIAPMWLDAGNGIERHEKWLDFIIPLKDKLGFDAIYFVDNASSEHKLWYLQKKYGFLHHRCSVHIPRKDQHAYGYWYTALAIGMKHAIDNGYDKVIHIDTDVYPLSERICEYVRSVTDGWRALWCPRHNFPETTFQVIGKDKFHDFYAHMSRDFLRYYPEGMAETNIPFTHVEKGIKGDRYGEENNGLGADQTKEMDFYGQCPVTKELKFGL